MAFGVLIVGQIVMFFASLSLLDRPPVLLLSLILGVGPLIFRYLAVRTKWGESHQRSIRTMFKWAAIAMVALVATIIANSFLDRSPTTEIHANVIEKRSHSGKGGSDYTLMVAPSWRPGRQYESLDTGRETFSRVHVGSTISVDLHTGFFHLPWYSNVRSD